MAIDTIDTPVSSTIRLNRPIPGQGLTSDPDNPYPWEKPPEFTDLEDGLQYVFGRLINPEAYVSIMNVIDDGTALMDITQGILFKGFTEGKWNPDLMMMLAEPITYMLAAFAEQEGIEFTIQEDDEEDIEEEEEAQSLPMMKQALKQVKTVDNPEVVPDQVQSLLAARGEQ